MQNIKTAPTFFIIKNVAEIKNVKKRKKRDINTKRKKTFFTSMLCSVKDTFHWTNTSRTCLRTFFSLTNHRFASNLCNEM